MDFSRKKSLFRVVKFNKAMKRDVFSENTCSGFSVT